MPKVTCILLFSLVAFASSLPQIAWQGREPGLSIAQQIGDGIRNVPIPPPWYFLKNKSYWNMNGVKTTTEGTKVNNNRGKISNGVAPGLVSKFNTDKPNPTTAKIKYVPFTTTPRYRLPNAWSSTTPPVFTSTTRRVPPQFIYTSYRPPITSTAVPSSTFNYVSTTQSTYPSSNPPNVSDPSLTNGHSKPLYASEYPSFVSEITTEVSKLPTLDDTADPSGSLQTSTIESLDKEKDLENTSGIETTTVLSDSATLSQTDPDPLNYGNNDSISDKDRRNTTNDTEIPVSNPGLLFSGPQICKKRNAYYGVGENHSFYVECQDYQPALKLCPDNFNFDSNVQWPAYPCKHVITIIENQAQVQ